MDSNAVPLIRLEIENLKHAIIRHMGAVGSELGERLSEQIDKAIEEYPWEEQVKKITHEAIDDTIERYFKHGHGMTVLYRVLDDSIRGMGNGTER